MWRKNWPKDPRPLLSGVPYDFKGVTVVDCISVQIEKRKRDSLPQDSLSYLEWRWMITLQFVKSWDPNAAIVVKRSFGAPGTLPKNHQKKVRFKSPSL